MPSRILIVAIPLLLAAYIFSNRAASPEPEETSTVVDDISPTEQSVHEDVEIEEWDVPWPNTRPRDPDVAPDGRIVFVGQRGDYIGRFDLATGEFDRWMLDPGTGPHTVIVDDEGKAWYAGNHAAHIGQLDMTTGEITTFDVPQSVRDPHTMAWDSNGNIWFTAQHAGAIGKLTVATGKVQVAEVGQSMRPYGLVVDANDHPWFVTMGSNKVGTIDPETMALTLHDTPDEASRIRRLGISSDGHVWWTDAAQGYLGVLDPETGEMQQWLSPGGESTDLYALAVDVQDRVWYVETGPDPNRLVGFDPENEAFFSITDIPSGAGSVRNMVYNTETNAIWFGTDTNTIGRAVLPE